MKVVNLTGFTVACKSAQMVVEWNPLITTSVYTESLLYRQTSCATNEFPTVNCAINALGQNNSN